MSALHPAARLSRDLWALLTGVLLVHLGWYLVLSFVAVVLTTRRGLTPG